MTRKLTAALAIALALASLAAFASRGNGGAVRGAAARAGMMAEAATPTASSYVQSGIISMWDGIENAGWDVHSTTTTIWKDLIGGHNATLNSGTSVKDSYIQFNGTQSISAGNILSSAISQYTIEIVYSNPNADAGIVYCDSSGFLFWRYSSLEMEWYSGGVKGITPIPSVGVAVVISCVNGSSALTYQNGTLKTTRTSSASFKGSGMIFGAYGSRIFTGRLYCIRIYNRALTAAEIAHNYSVDRRRFNLP